MPPNAKSAEATEHGKALPEGAPGGMEFPEGAPGGIEFQRMWQSFYGATPPIGYLLRLRHPDRWWRIHSMADSSRYASTTEERDELLRRQNAVASAVLGDGGRCLLVFAHFRAPGANPRKSPPRSLPTSLSALPGISLVRLAHVDASWPAATVIEEEIGERELWLYTHALLWRPGMMDAALLAIANDETRALLVNVDTGHVFAPYDGGVDLFCTAPAALKSRFAEWASPHPEGL